VAVELVKTLHLVVQVMVLHQYFLQFHHQAVVAVLVHFPLAVQALVETAVQAVVELLRLEQAIQVAILLLKVMLDGNKQVQQQAVVVAQVRQQHLKMAQMALHHQ
jgi:hypothetical protein